MANEQNLRRLDSKTAAEIGAKGGAAKKGKKHISTHIQEMLNDPNFELKLKDGSILKGRPIEAIIKTAVAKGISGNVQWAEWLAKHGFGSKLIIGTEDPAEAALRKLGLLGEQDAGEDTGTPLATP